MNMQLGKRRISLAAERNFTGGVPLPSPAAATVRAQPPAAAAASGITTSEPGGRPAHFFLPCCSLRRPPTGRPLRLTCTQGQSRTVAGTLCWSISVERLPFFDPKEAYARKVPRRVQLCQRGGSGRVARGGKHGSAGIKPAGSAPRSCRRSPGSAWAAPCCARWAAPARTPSRSSLLAAGSTGQFNSGLAGPNLGAKPAFGGSRGRAGTEPGVAGGT